jgi:AcrR family transcriptional regulator
MPSEPCSATARTMDEIPILRNEPKDEHVSALNATPDAEKISIEPKEGLWWGGPPGPQSAPWPTSCTENCETNLPLSISLDAPLIQTYNSNSRMNAIASKSDTKQRILDSAERLFADNGFDSTSLRTIIADAQVNLAAIHYHYHSKEALLDAVILRRLEPINRQRLEMLDACEQAAGDASPSLEAVIEAFLAPAFRVASDHQYGKSFARLMGRILTAEKSLVPRMKQHMSEMLGRFLQALQKAVPELPRHELFWRIQFMGGAMALTLLRGKDLEALSDGLCDTSDVEGTIRRLVDFAAAGFRAQIITPSVSAGESGGGR